jgi:hypothetical protein
MTKYSKNIKVNELLMVIVFIVILFTPLVGPKETESLENRSLAQFPEWRWSNVWKFFDEYQNYFDDCFAFRNDIIDSYGNFIYNVLDIKPITNTVINGEDEWLFYSDKDYIKITSTPFTHEELSRIHYNLVVTTEWFKEHDIKYYLMLLPVKSRIYSDKLPEYMKVKMSFSRLDQIREYLIKHSSINIIDCKDDLTAARKEGDVYYKSDTHWNERGAFVGYTSILKRIKNDFPEITPMSIDNYNSNKEWNDSGDLQRMLGFEPEFKLKQDVLTLKNSIATNQIFLGYLDDNPKKKYEIYRTPTDTNGLKIFVVRDSFTENLKKFLSVNFSTSIYAWMPEIPMNKIVEENPNIVLHEMLERFTFEYLQLPPEIENDTTFTKQFNIEDY